MMHYYSRFVFVFFMLGSTLGYGQIFQPAGDDLVYSEGGKIQWADLDGDMDLDLLYSGMIDGGMPGTAVYENVNGAFVQHYTNLPPIRNGAFALGDYDNDGDLDVFLSGISEGFATTSVLYTNGGGFSFSLRDDLSFPSLVNSNPAWFDMDNDGDVDLLLTGVDDQTLSPIYPFISYTHLYENNGGIFTEVASGLPGCGQCAVAIADANNDGKVDVMLSGFDQYMMGATNSLWLNNGDKTFSAYENSVFRYSYNGDIQWGDFDNDGDMDLLQSGSTGGITDQGHTTVYENTDGVFTERADIVLAPSGGYWYGATAWLDYDNDQYLDIIVSGTGSAIKLYHNNRSGNFTAVSGEVFPTVYNSSLDFGDYDNDGDIDISLTGGDFSGQGHVILRNTLSNTAASANTRPVRPASSLLWETFSLKNVSLGWNESSDAQTPGGGLSYNFYLRNASGRLYSPAANISSGFLQSILPPNGQAHYVQLGDLAEGEYFWAVQAIDGARQASLFSTERRFYKINGPEVTGAEVTTFGPVLVSWIDNSAIENKFVITRRKIGGSTVVREATANAVGYLDTDVLDTDALYRYDVQAVMGTNFSPSDSAWMLIPTAPANLSATWNGSRVDLSWTDRSTRESSYIVYRQADGETQFTDIAVLPAGSTTYTDINVVQDGGYKYAVRALGTYAYSAQSNIATAGEITGFLEVSMIDDQRATLSSSIPPINFIVDDPGNTPSSLRVSARSDNQGLIRDTGIALSLDDQGNGTIVLTPEPGVVDKAVITITVSNGRSAIMREFSVSIVNDVVMGIDPVKERVTVYPNPTTSVLHISGYGERAPMIAVVRDLLGREMLRQSVTGDAPVVSVERLEAGMYMLTLVRGDLVLEVVKFVRE